LKTLALGLIAWLLFFWLGWEATHGGTERLDTGARVLVQEVASAPLKRAMRGFTFLGQAPILLALSFVGIATFYRQGRTRRAWALATVAAGGEVLERVLKLAYHRPRPEPFFGTAKPDSYSFPSGHAMLSCTILLALAWLIGARGLRGLWIWTAAALLTLAIGTSRIYLGVHYASDVLGGYLAALGWLCVVRTIYARHL
jgi:undecaprenyl-diphosphatase